MQQQSNWCEVVAAAAADVAVWMLERVIQYE